MRTSMGDGEKKAKRRKNKKSTPFVCFLQPGNGGNPRLPFTSTRQHLLCHDVTSAPGAEHRSANTAKHHQGIRAGLMCGSWQVLPAKEASGQLLTSGYRNHRPSLHKAALLLLFYLTPLMEHVLLLNLNDRSMLQQHQ